MKKPPGVVFPAAPPHFEASAVSAALKFATILGMSATSSLSPERG
jgi:hypothetical protein